MPSVDSMESKNEIIQFGSSIFQKMYDIVVVNAKFTFAKSVEM